MTTLITPAWREAVFAALIADTTVSEVVAVAAPVAGSWGIDRPGWKLGYEENGNPALIRQ